MARIRTVKPEFFTSETILALSHAARLTFIGVWTEADDAGRCRDDPRLIKGAVWPLEDQVTHTDVALHLEEMAMVGLICRYESGGKRYLHVVSWDEHQKIDRVSKTKKLPECPRASHGPPPDGSSNSNVTLDEPSTSMHRAPDEPSGTGSGSGKGTGEQEVPPSAGRDAPAADPPTLTLVSSDTPAAALKPAEPPPPSAQPVTAQTLLGEHLDACPKRPPKRVVGHLSGEIKKLLGEGIDPVAVRGGLAILRDRGLDPSKLPSTTNQTLNPPAPRRGYSRASPDGGTFDYLRQLHAEAQAREGG